MVSSRQNEINHQKAYDSPTQVMFYDFNESQWVSGIAYGDEVICGCCGSVFSLEEIHAEAAEDGLESGVYAYSNWIDISEEIMGGELPDGLDFDKNGEILEEDNVPFPEAY